MSGIKELTPEEKKRLKQLAVSVAITGFFAMLGAILKNPFVFALQGIGLILTIISIFRMIAITRVKNN